jgi:thiol-disulfide isomerase/thioredoxin
MMKSISIALALAVATPAVAALVEDVQSATMSGNFPAAEAMLDQYRRSAGVTPEWIAAYSWLARGALGAKLWDKAESYALKTHEFALAALKKRKLDAEGFLPIGLGASIEVQGKVLAARGDRAQAVAFLNRELALYKGTSIHARIQKNINLISLVGKRAPALVMSPVLGPKCKPAEKLAGQPALLFFWAHWCSDCKLEAPVIERIHREFKDLRIVAPTMLYGYVAGGVDAPPARETQYIEEIRKQYYGQIVDCSTPVNSENFNNYGSSSTPTLVLLDRQNVVRLYHPGNMSYEQLVAEVRKVMAK